MKKLIVLSCMSAFAIASPITLQDVLIEGDQEQNTIESSQIQFTKQQDLSEILSSINPEINMVRASAIGNDIVLRGFKRDDINVLIDGAKIYGACPNRMDPPAMHVSIADIESVKLLEGPFDVENFGSMGGVVEVATKDPQKGIGGRAAVTVGSFGYNKFDASFHAADEKLGVMLGITHENSGQYEDGNGQNLVEQNWAQLGTTDPYAYQAKYKDMDAYTRDSVKLKAVYNLDEKQKIKLSMYGDKATNVLYPAFQMDAQLDKTIMINGSYIVKDLGAFSKELELSGYYSHVKHDMGTEFRNAATNPMLYRTHRVKSTIEGLKLKNSFELSGIAWKIGVDVSKRNWNGICLSEPSETPKQLRIPDVDTKNGALFAEAKKRIGKMIVKVGVRYDNTDIDANANLNDATVVPTAVRDYYSGKTSKSYHDFSANLVANYQVNSQNSIYVAIGRGIRVPDAQELYFIGYMNGNWTRKGNPDLKEAKNSEIDFGVKSTIFETQIDAKIFYSKLDDYIYAYKTDAGNTAGQYYLTWTNIDAHIYGFSLDVARGFGDYFLFEGSLSYQRGQKDDMIAGQSDKDLAQIPPLHGRLAISYDDGSYYAACEALMSAGWSDYDSDNGERHVGGWGVVNLKASKEIARNTTLSVGVDNLFDKTYARNNTYAGRALIGATPLLINEPGRYLYANIEYKF